MRKQIRDADSVQTFTSTDTYRATLRYLDELAWAGLLEEVEHTKQQITDRLKEQDT